MFFSTLFTLATLLFASVAVAHPVDEAEKGTPVLKRSPSFTLIPIHYTPLPPLSFCSLPICGCSYTQCTSASGTLACCNPANEGCIESGSSQGTCCPTSQMSTNTNTGEPICCNYGLGTGCSASNPCSGGNLCVEGCCEKPPPKA